MKTVKNLNKMPQPQTTHLRIFFAIDLTLTNKESIAKILLNLQSHHKQPSIRWSKPENLHITLQFLAAVKSEDIEMLLANARKEITPFSPFELELGDPELFPTPYQPKIISLGIAEQCILDDLSKRIGRGVLATGYPIETRPFRGHLTLARLNSIKKFELAEISHPKLETLYVKEIALYSSQPNEHGSQYTLLGKIPLNAL